jgi:hypothetical protein
MTWLLFMPVSFAVLKGGMGLHHSFMAGRMPNKAVAAWWLVLRIQRVLFGDTGFLPAEFSAKITEHIEKI